MVLLVVRQVVVSSSTGLYAAASSWVWRLRMIIRSAETWALIHPEFYRLWDHWVLLTPRDQATSTWRWWTPILKWDSGAHADWRC